MDPSCFVSITIADIGLQDKNKRPKKNSSFMLEKEELLEAFFGFLCISV